MARRFAFMIMGRVIIIIASIFEMAVAVGTGTSGELIRQASSEHLILYLCTKLDMSVSSGNEMENCSLKVNPVKGNVTTT